MNIAVQNNQATILLPLLDNSFEFQEVEFVVDTGFTGTIFFSVNPSWDIFKIFQCTDIAPLEKNDWVILANGERVKTFAGNVSLFLENKNITFPVRITVGENIETPLVGMKFLELLQAKFSIDFFKNIHLLQFHFLRDSD